MRLSSWMGAMNNHKQASESVWQVVVPTIGMELGEAGVMWAQINHK